MSYSSTNLDLRDHGFRKHLIKLDSLLRKYDSQPLESDLWCVFERLHVTEQIALFFREAEVGRVDALHGCVERVEDLLAMLRQTQE